jgi:DNA-binding NarL/FixJ family response regulator
MSLAQVLVVGELDDDSAELLARTLATLRHRCPQVSVHVSSASAPPAEPAPTNIDSAVARLALLTGAEERMAHLVQLGLRNREIAAALHYAPRSVEVYLSRIYAKLGLSSRLQLARTLDAAGHRAALTHRAALAPRAGPAHRVGLDHLESAGT